MSNLPWDSALLDASSAIHKRVSDTLVREIRSTYADFSGRQTVNVLTFSENNSQSLVLVDLSTTNDVDMENLKSIFEGKLRMEQLGPYQAKVAGENWWRKNPGKSKI